MSACSDRGGSIRRRWPAVLQATAVCTLVSGLFCLGLYAIAQADQKIVSAAAVAAFQQARDDALARTPDRALWSPGRRSAYDEARPTEPAMPTALLRIPSLDLLVPVFDGTSELVLNRGVGWIETTAMPGTDGNIGLAGHRDGFFRKLKDLQIGDTVEVQTVEASRRYRVTDVSIVEPTDVHVLAPTGEPSVTLVTCYPFYYVGDAPQRFIVRGVIDQGSIRAAGQLVNATVSRGHDKRSKQQ
jgi:sortase A